MTTIKKERRVMVKKIEGENVYIIPYWFEKLKEGNIFEKIRYNLEYKPVVTCILGISSFVITVILLNIISTFLPKYLEIIIPTLVVTGLFALSIYTMFKVSQSTDKYDESFNDIQIQEFLLIKDFTPMLKVGDELSIELNIEKVEQGIAFYTNIK